MQTEHVLKGRSRHGVLTQANDFRLNQGQWALLSSPHRSATMKWTISHTGSLLPVAQTNTQSTSACEPAVWRRQLFTENNQLWRIWRKENSRASTYYGYMSIFRAISIVTASVFQGKHVSDILNDVLDLWCFIITSPSSSRPLFRKSSCIIPAYDVKIIFTRELADERWCCHAVLYADDSFVYICPLCCFFEKLLPFNMASRCLTPLMVFCLGLWYYHCVSERELHNYLSTVCEFWLMSKIKLHCVIETEFRLKLKTRCVLLL